MAFYQVFTNFILSASTKQPTSDASTDEKILVEQELETQSDLAPPISHTLPVTLSSGHISEIFNRPKKDPLRAPSTTNRFQRPPEQPDQLSSRSISAPSCPYNKHLISVYLFPPSSRLTIEFRRLSATVATAQLFPEGLHSASISLSDRTLSATKKHSTKGPTDSKDW